MDLPPLSNESQALMSAAAAECRRRGHNYLGVEHLFFALARAAGSSLAGALAQQGIEAERFVEELMAQSPAAPRPVSGDVVLTPRAQEVLRLAAEVASRAGAARVDDGHLLEAILREGRSTPLRRLRAEGAQITALHASAPAVVRTAQSQPTPMLDRLGRDVTARARAGALSAVVGREHELGQLASVLLRRNKNNAVLVGEAGVGKTAIVEALAELLVSKACPAPLVGSRLIELSVASLVAGTRYRGDFEERLLAVVQEAQGNRGLILFIDELHTLLGAGGAEGALDAANILKPALARGDLHCIGATTIAEYRRFIESDAALERRFEKVLVEEPAPATARRMLSAAAGTLAAFHGVTIGSEAVEAALALTVRYVPQRRLPDKAIDALDQTCARVRLNRAAANEGRTVAEVGGEDIASTVAEWTGIPVERLSGQEAQRLLRLDEDLRCRVVGQDHAVTLVARAIVTSRAGLSDPRRPQGVFLFLGPTGVGKTELARSLAEAVFGDARRLLRYDMSEYAEPHSAAALLGAPPGYVGYEQEGRLVGAIRTAPNSVVLFDEVEKAHPRIFDLFLQIFDDGRLRGASGVEADFRHAIIVLTSNLNPRPEIEKHVGFASAPEEPGALDPRLALAAYFRPELLNRIDEIVLFNSLGPTQLRRIVGRQVEEIAALAAGRGVRLVLDDAVLDWLIAQAAPEAFGARELRRVLDRHLRQPLAREMLERQRGAGEVRIDLAGGALRFVDA